MYNVSQPTTRPLGLKVMSVLFPSIVDIQGHQVTEDMKDFCLSVDLPNLSNKGILSRRQHRSLFLKNVLEVKVYLLDTYSFIFCIRLFLL